MNIQVKTMILNSMFQEMLFIRKIIISNSGRNLDGYMSHVAFVDGSVVAPTVFGETDSTSGIWKFKSPSGVTWGNKWFSFKI